MIISLDERTWYLVSQRVAVVSLSICAQRFSVGVKCLIIGQLFLTFKKRERPTVIAFLRAASSILAIAECAFQGLFGLAIARVVPFKAQSIKSSCRVWSASTHLPRTANRKLSLRASSARLQHRQTWLPPSTFMGSTCPARLPSVRCMDAVSNRNPLKGSISSWDLRRRNHHFFRVSGVS